jgi:CheY-like chemotaxis protein
MKILLAEDDKDAATLSKWMLEKRGYKVIIAENGQECLEVYHEELHNTTLNTDPSLHTQPFDAVVLDYKMPKINGIEVAKEIFTVNQRQRIIFASAHVQDTLVDCMQKLDQTVELIQKPFGEDVLLDTIEDKQIYSELQKLSINIDDIKTANFTHKQLTGLLEVLKNTRAI